MRVRERESVCIYVKKRGKRRERVCVCMFERGRKREGERGHSESGGPNLNTSSSR